MKIKQVNPGLIEGNKNGLMALIAGALLVVAGAVLGVVLFIIAEEVWLGLIGLVVMAIGALIAFGAEKVEMSLSSDGQSTRRSTRLLTSKVSEVSFDAKDVEKVVLETTTEVSSDSDGNTNRQRKSVLYVELKNSSQIILMASSSGGGLSVSGVNVSSFGKAPLADEAEQIAKLFDVSVEYTGGGLASLGQVVKQVKSAMDETRSDKV